MSKTHEYRGSLSDTTLPEMLSSISRFRVPGTVQAKRGEVVKRVLIRDGYVIHASSNDRRDSLGEYLLRTGKLDQGDYERTAQARTGGTKRFGVLLIEQGLLTPAEIYAAIRAHIEEIVWSLFYWSSGVVAFDIGEFKEEDLVQIQLPLRRVILEGIKRAPEAKPFLDRLGKRETVVEPCFRWEDLIELALERAEYQLLMAVDSKKTLYELCSQKPLNASQNAKLLYAFRVLHLIRRSETEVQPSPGVAKIRMRTQGGAFSS
jgi:hypothetical protein